MKTINIILFVLFLAAACSDGGTTPGGPNAGSHILGDFTVVVTANGLAIHRKSDGALLLNSATAHGTKINEKAPPPLLGWRKAEVDIKTAYGMSIFDETAPNWTRVPGITVSAATKEKLTLKAGVATVELRQHKPGVLSVTVTAPSTANRVAMSFDCGAGDKFYGMGALVHGTQHRGEMIPTWTGEQGIGKIRRKFLSDNFL